uniref:Uncharacterized protein orf229 n=1 Tax=Cyanophora paradoxa TaxID=2762 RepID=E9P1C5_CYAPA|nr:hypothetical protein CYPAM_p06 [Cyanophora paradoxa]ADW79177.1 hypothetical protein [Cyanophora paradoxa]
MEFLLLFLTHPILFVYYIKLVSVNVVISFITDTLPLILCRICFIAESHGYNFKTFVISLSENINFFFSYIIIKYFRNIKIKKKFNNYIFSNTITKIEQFLIKSLLLNDNITKVLISEFKLNEIKLFYGIIFYFFTYTFIFYSHVFLFSGQYISILLIPCSFECILATIFYLQYFDENIPNNYVQKKLKAYRIIFVFRNITSKIRIIVRDFIIFLILLYYIYLVYYNIFF